MNWNLCIICQKVTSEALSCPQNKSSCDALNVYNSFLENVDQFKQLDALPVDVDFRVDGTASGFVKRNASWHRSCHQQFNNSKLEKEQNKKRKHETRVEDSKRQSKRKTTGSSSITSLCIFCGIDNSCKLHEYATQSAERSLREMCQVMQDTELLAKISGGDLVAIEAKHHFLCLTKYRNRYRAFCQNKSDISNSQRERVKARAFAELVCDIETSVENGCNVLKLSNLHHAYENRVRELGENISINKIRIKEKLLDHFADMGLQEQCDGKHSVLIFPAGMQQMLKDAFLHRDYEEETVLFAKVAKICREEIFKRDSCTFSGRFTPNCQEDTVAPSIALLTSMILSGPAIKDNATYSQDCLTISQLFIHNVKKRAKDRTVLKRHSMEREPPIPVYIGMNIHTVSRNKKLIDQLASLGISITYDRVLQLEHSISVSMCRQFEADNIVCPSNLRKGIF